MVEESFKLQFLQAVSSLIIAAFALVAALAWNAAIQEGIKELFKDDGSLIGLFVYALIVTVIAVLATLIITRAVKKTQTALEAEEKQKSE
jgi:ABC-type multidrug transport system fused ATPase/permease subunit